MSKKSVFCIATSREQADRMVNELKNEKFSNNDISALFADKATSHDFAHEKHTKAPEGTATGAGTGGVIGGALGWIAGIGALAIPGVGPFIAAGPIGLGIPEMEAKRYEGKVKAGNILISVHTDNSEQIAQAKDIFKAAGGQDICSTGEAATPGKKIKNNSPKSNSADHKNVITHS